MKRSDVLLWILLALFAVFVLVCFTVPQDVLDANELLGMLWVAVMGGLYIGVYVYHKRGM